jgi:hypothetical protein
MREHQKSQPGLGWAGKTPSKDSSKCEGALSPSETAKLLALATPQSKRLKLPLHPTVLL